jgi:branched-chain amino acid transport system substrate-binding protein
MEADTVPGVWAKLLDDHPDVIMSVQSSTTNFEIDIAQQAGIIYYLASQSQLTVEYTKDIQKYWMIFSPEPPVDAYGDSLPALLTKWQAANLMPTGKGVKRNTVYMFTTQNSYSQLIRTDYLKTLPAAGFTIIGDDLAPEGDMADFSALLAKLRENPPYIFVSTDYRPGNHANFIKQFVQNPTNSYVYQQYGPSVSSYLTIAGSAATGVFWNTIIGLINSPKYPQGAQFYTDFKTRWGNEPSWAYASTMYDCVFMWVQAVQKAGSLDQKAVATAQEGLQYTGLDGTYVYDQNHIAKAGEDYLPTLTYQIWNSQYMFVDPEKWAVAPFKVPPWMQTE